MHVVRRSSTTICALLCVGLVLGGARPARAETRAFAFPTALRPGSLNNIAASRTAPVAFVGSRDTDTVFAFDPRSGAYVGEIQVADGPLSLTLLELDGRRLLGVTCDGFLGASPNVVALVDATDPTAMSLVRTVPLPEGYVFLLGHQTMRFVDDAGSFVVTATDPVTAKALLVSYDGTSGAELDRVEVGFVPASIFVRETGGRRIVALSQSVAPHGRITIVDATDLAALSVERIIRLPNKSGLYNVNNVVLDGDGSHGFVASGDGNVLYSFEVGTGRVLSRIVTGSFPTTIVGFEVDGAPLLLVTNEASASLSVYDVRDPATPTLVSHFDASSAFLDVAPSISSDGRTVFVASTDQNKMFAVDTLTGGLRYRVPTGKRPVSSAVWEGGGQVFSCFAASTGANVTTVRDDVAGAAIQTFGGPAGAVYFTLYQNVAFSRDGRYAFVASKLTNELLSFDAESGSLVGRIGVSVAPSQIAVADGADGRRRVAVLGSGDSVLTVVDATDPAALAVQGAVSIESPYPFYLEFANIAVTGDGSTAFVADGNQFVYSIDLATATIAGSTGTGFAPVTLALREDRGQRRLAVLNAMSGSSSVAVLDATNPAAMSQVAAAALPQDLVVALNNVPKFTVDGRYVVVGASLSERVLTIDAETGRIAGSISKTSSVVAAPFADGGTQRFATVELGTDEGTVYRLKKSGKPRSEVALKANPGGFFLVGNDPIVGPDGSTVLVTNFGSANLLAFDARTGVFTGELPLGRGPGQFALGAGSGAVAALEVNGTASRVLFAHLSDLGTPTASRPKESAPSGLRTSQRSTGAVGIATVKAPTGRVATYSIGRRSLLEWTPPSKPN